MIVPSLHTLAAAILALSATMAVAAPAPIANIEPLGPGKAVLPPPFSGPDGEHRFNDATAVHPMNKREPFRLLPGETPIAEPPRLPNGIPLQIKTAAEKRSPYVLLPGEEPRPMPKLPNGLQLQMKTAASPSSQKRDPYRLLPGEEAHPHYLPNGLALSEKTATTTTNAKREPYVIIPGSGMKPLDRPLPFGAQALKRTLPIRHDRDGEHDGQTMHVSTPGGGLKPVRVPEGQMVAL